MRLPPSLYMPLPAKMVTSAPSPIGNRYTRTVKPLADYDNCKISFLVPFDVCRSGLASLLTFFTVVAGLHGRWRPFLGRPAAALGPVQQFLFDGVHGQPPPFLAGKAGWPHRRCQIAGRSSSPAVSTTPFDDDDGRQSKCVMVADDQDAAAVCSYILQHGKVRKLRGRPASGRGSRAGPARKTIAILLLRWLLGAGKAGEAPPSVQYGSRRVFR